MTSGSFEHLGDQSVYRGYIWEVVVGSFRDPAGETFTRDIVRSPGAVAVVPLIREPDGSHSVVLLRQYRAAFAREIVEVPAGMRDVDGEDPEQTARRELIEETGYDAGSLRLLHRFYPSTGMTDSVLHVYLATDLRHVGRQMHGPEEAHMEVFTVPFADAVGMVVSGEIADAKSTIGLLLADRLVRGLDADVI
ncbi:MAG: NUDIX hydrolase [Ilumatobacteraceae bacterium]|nr:NUDIX hydrolase [Ilumatobacteraceae bacterium]